MEQEKERLNLVNDSAGGGTPEQDELFALPVTILESELPCESESAAQTHNDPVESGDVLIRSMSSQHVGCQAAEHLIEPGGFVSTAIQNVREFLDSERFKVSFLIVAIVLLGGGFATALEKFSKLPRDADAAFQPLGFFTGTMACAVGKPDISYALQFSTISKEDRLKPLSGDIQTDFLRRPHLDGDDRLLTNLSAWSMYKNRGNVEKSKQFIDYLLRMKPRSASLRAWNVSDLEARQEYSAAEAEIDKAIALDKGEKTSKSYFVDRKNDFLPERCQLLACQGKWTRILELTETSPNSSVALQWRGQALFRTGRINAALSLQNSYLAKAEEEEKNEEVALPYTEASAETVTNKPVEASNETSQAGEDSIKSHKDNFDDSHFSRYINNTRLWRGRIQLMKGDEKSAKAEAGELLKSAEPSDPVEQKSSFRSSEECCANSLLSDICSKNGNYKQALVYLEQSLSTPSASTSDSSYAVARMFILNKLGRYHECLAYAAEFNQLDLDTCASSYYCQRGVAQFHSGDFAAALSSAERAIKLNGGTRTCYEICKLAAGKLGDTEKASQFDVKLKQLKFGLELPNGE